MSPDPLAASRESLLAVSTAAASSTSSRRYAALLCVLIITGLSLLIAASYSGQKATVSNPTPAPEPLSASSSAFPWLQSPVPPMPGSNHPALHGAQVDPPYAGCTADTVVHVVCSNHFDLGYKAYQPVGDFAWQVMNQTMQVSTTSSRHLRHLQQTIAAITTHRFTTFAHHPSPHSLSSRCALLCRCGCPVPWSTRRVWWRSTLASTPTTTPSCG